MKKKLVQEWFKNNNIKKQYWTLRGKISGTLYSFFAHGKPRAVLNYEKGKLHGLQQYFWSNGNIKDTFEYDHGVKHGEVQTFNSAGTIVKQSARFERGKKSGEWLEWYDEQQFGTVNYKNGKLNGAAFLQSHACGTKEEGVFINNKKHGLWITQDSKKNLVRKLNFVDNALHGECIEYNSGQKRAVSNFKDGLRHGDFTMYYPDGKIEIKAVYRKNRAVQWLQFDSDGNLKPSNPLDPRR